ncbi:PIG-L deacetylase family protein [Deinococcus aquiradiocola]|uniref:PIG-L domain-containing protein n=1 Tax=Deinococcus aquiradiocola TaxID=393059 RepID=A0A917PA19_9DEIO|nr:PIG-L deacetylase family protein [Deinococcus aquiradiocola]GGJ68263.1 PIG-L domain-containing protein [Deinococcus aquiradiocola]
MAARVNGTPPRQAGLLDPAALTGPVWVVAPHPDDEALGCGALIAALTDAGQEVWALLLSDGGFSHPASAAYPRERLVRTRLAEWRAGLAVLGVPAERTAALGFPDGALAGHAQEIQEAARAAFRAAPPATVLLPWGRDPHPDHRAAWATLHAALPGPCRVLLYTVWLQERGQEGDWPAPGEARTLTFPPSGWADRKAAAIAAHATQLGTITDDPGGFTLAPDMIARAVREPETYFEVNP